MADLASVAASDGPGLLEARAQIERDILVWAQKCEILRLRVRDCYRENGRIEHVKACKEVGDQYMELFKNRPKTYAEQAGELNLPGGLIPKNRQPASH